MMKLLLLILPLFAAADIQIEITATKNPQEQNVYLLGEQTDVISDAEIMTFDIGDNNLKDAVEAYYGKRPDEAILKNPSGWDDVYFKYNWKEVSRTLKPIAAKVLQIKSEPEVVLFRQNFENNSTMPTSVNVGISQNIQNNVSSSWNAVGSLTLGSDINYKVNFGDAEIGESMSFSNSWGKGTEELKTMTVGSATGMEIMLQPGDNVMAELQAARTTIQVEVIYEAYLSGDVVVNYADRRYKGHHLAPLDVRGVMHAGNINNSIRSTEVIDISFYSEPKVFIYDSNNAKVITFNL